MTDITLNGANYTLTAPLLGQLRQISAILDEEAPVGMVKTIERAVRIVGAGLSKDFPNIKFDDGFACSVEELKIAMGAVIAHCGFVPAKPGEAAAPASGA